MKIGLFIPCYIDNFYPNVGKSCWDILKNKLKCEVEYPMSQTCCGQPLGNAGFDKNNKGIEKNFIKNFLKYDYIVAPSGSCVHFVKHHYDAPADVLEELNHKTYEFCDFFLNVLNIDKWEANYPHKVAIHNSCHAHRGLSLGNPSELKLSADHKDHKDSVAERTLALIKGVEIVKLNREDECCGFGGTFSVFEEAVSVRMGQDRLKDHLDNNVHTITALDSSCLMHLDGLIKRNKYNLITKHLVELLNPVL